MTLMTAAARKDIPSPAGTSWFPFGFAATTCVTSGIVTEVQMLKVLLGAGALVLTTAQVSAQVSPATTGTLTAGDVGAMPIAGQSGPSFVQAAWDANLYQIKAAQLAGSKAQRDDVKAYARAVLDDARAGQKALLASLRNDQRTIKAPSDALSTERASLLKLLQGSPRGSFDNLYLTQVAQVQQQGWSVAKGYATDGTDPVLKLVAGSAVPVLERELTAGKDLLPNALAN